MMDWITSIFSESAKSVVSQSVIINQNIGRLSQMKKIFALVILTSLFAGCAYVGPWIKEIKWPSLFPGKEEVGITQKDEIPIESVKWGNPEASLWPITYTCRATHEGGNSIYLHQDATMVWKSIDNVCASLWLIGDWGNGDIHGLSMEYVRSGGSGWNKKTMDLEWKYPNGKKLKDAQKIYVMVSGLCRDARRNVKERCPIVVVEE